MIPLRLKQGRGSPSWGRDERVANYVVALTPMLGGYRVLWTYPNDPQHPHESSYVYDTTTVIRLMREHVWVRDLPNCVLLPEGL